LVPTRDLDLHLDLGSRYTSLSKLSTHFSSLTRKYTDHGTATMTKYTSIHLDPALGQVPAKIELYLRKQCTYPLVETQPIADTNN